MSRTVRRRWVHVWGEGAFIDQSGRDDGCRHWCCNGWKRPARKSTRMSLKALLRRKPEEA